MTRSRRISSAFAGLLIIVLVVVISYFLISPPSVLGAKRTGNIQPIAVNAPFSVDFSSWMDKESTEAAVSIEPALEGTFSWDGNTLLYTPTTPLVEGNTYTISVQPTAKNFVGKQLSESYEITYVVTPAPEVTFVSPENIIVETTQPITIMFSSPMVPVSTLDTPNLGEVSLTIEPETPGSFRWIDTQTLQFTATKGLLPSSHYIVTVQKGSRSEDGGYIETDTQFTFDTEAPVVVSTDPEEGYALAGPPSPLQITFNQQMDLQEIKNTLEVQPKTGVDISYAPNDPNTVIITPTPAWAFQTAYELRLPVGIKGTQGTKTMTDPFTFRFNTVGTPELLSSTPAKEEQNASIYGFTLDFNTPLPDNGLAGFFSIEPAVDGFTVTHDAGNSVSLDMSLAYSTTYTVHIKKGLKDIYGQTLAEDISYQFTTTDRPRSISIEKRDNFSMFSSYEQVVYPIKTVNIPSYTVSFCSISLDNFLSRAHHQSETPPCTLRTWEMTVPHQKNLLSTTQIDFAKQLDEALTPGIYYMSVQAPTQQTEDWRHKDYMYFFVTDTALSLKTDDKNILVWATDLHTGTPVANTQVELFKNGQRITEATTDEQGLATFAKIDDYHEWYVVARRGEGISLASTYWDSGIAPWEFDISQEYSMSPFVGYLYTERPIYRPSDTVHFKGMVRFDNDAFYELPAKDTKISVELLGAESESLETKQFSLNENGTFAGEFVLPSQANIGQYSIQWTVNDQHLDRGGYRAFFVEEYRRPEFQVAVNTAKTSIINGEDIQADIAASYFFGGALSDAKYTWTLQKTNYFFDAYTEGWYNFAGDEDYYSCSMGSCADESTIITEGSGTLTAEGKAKLSIPLTTNDDRTSKLYTLEVTVTDTNGQSFSARTTLPWHMGTYYIGMKNDSYVVPAKEEATFQLLTVDTLGSPVPNKSLSVEFFQRRWNSVKKQNVDGNYYWETEIQDTPVGKKTASTGADAKGSTSFTPTTGGYYIAKATGTDERGNKITSMAGVYVADEEYAAWNQSNTNRIDLIADQQEYQIGDTATVLIPSPFAASTALITYERGSIFHTEVRHLSSATHTLSIPITEKFLPNTFVSVVLIKDMRNTPEGTPRIPEFRVGYKNLIVSPKEKELHISFTTDKERYLPGETVTLTVTTKDHTGAPVDAEVAVGIVDASILALKGNPKEALLEEFYYERGLSVSTASNLTIFMDTINVNGKGAKGGGGGDDALAQKKRGEFKDTAYWNPSLQTQNGTSTVSFTLPDNLTTWHMVGLGITKETHVGNTEKDITATKELLVRPVLPRFLRFQDRATIGAVVHNFTETEQTVTVSLEGTNLELKTSAEKTNISIKPGASELLTWSVHTGGNTAMREDQSTITISARTTHLSDTVSTTLPIKPFATPETVAFFGSIDTYATEFLYFPEDMYRGLGSLRLLLANTLVTSLALPFDTLITYPYASTDTLASQLHAVGIRTNAEASGSSYLFGEKDTTQLQNFVQKNLPLFYQAQRSDGGWGYWYGSSRSYPYISAHAVEALTVLRSAGYSINEDVLRRGQTYLTETLKNTSTLSEYNNSPTERAYMLYALTYAGSTDTGLINNLFDRKNDLTLEGKAYLIRILQYNNDSRSKVLLDELLAQGLQDAQARYLHFSEATIDKRIMTSDVRTTALIAQAVLHDNAAHPLLPKMILWLQQQHTNLDRISTQDTLHTLQALATYTTKTSPNPTTAAVAVTLNDQALGEATLNTTTLQQTLTWPLQDLSASDAARSSLRMTAEGNTSPLYYEGTLSYAVPVQDIAPRNNGFAVQRSYYALSDTKKEQPVSFATQGETLRGKVTVVVPADRYNVAVEIHLPAGFEGVNFNLDTTAQALQEELEQDKTPWWYESVFTHTETRDDRIVLFADHLAPGVYEYEYFVNVTSQGIFAHPPTVAYEMYYPEVFGRSRGTLLNIR